MSGGRRLAKVDVIPKEDLLAPTCCPGVSKLKNTINLPYSTPGVSPPATGELKSNRIVSQASPTVVLTSASANWPLLATFSTLRRTGIPAAGATRIDMGLPVAVNGIGFAKPSSVPMTVPAKRPEPPPRTVTATAFCDVVRVVANRRERALESRSPSSRCPDRRRLPADQFVPGA